MKQGQEWLKERQDRLPDSVGGTDRCRSAHAIQRELDPQRRLDGRTEDPQRTVHAVKRAGVDTVVANSGLRVDRESGERAV